MPEPRVDPNADMRPLDAGQLLDGAVDAGRPDAEPEQPEPEQPEPEQPEPEQPEPEQPEPEQPEPEQPEPEQPEPEQPEPEQPGPAPEPEPEPEDLGRGLRWVRDNPTFISALTVRMGAPPAAFVDAYFDDFNANAVHLWATGVPTAMNAWRAARPGARWLAWLLDDGTSADGGAVLGGYAANTAGRIGWQIGDEPRTLEAFAALEAGFVAARQADPDALLVLNFTYLAEANLGQMIERSIRDYDVDVISYDRYSRGRSMWATLARFRTEGLRFGVPYWRYLNSYADANHELWAVSDTRWDALVGPLFGYTGHSWFIYQVNSPPPEGLLPVVFDRPNDLNAGRTALFGVIAELNVQLAHLGRVISQLTSTDVRYVPGLAGLSPEGVVEWAPGAGDDPYITLIEPVDVAPLVFQELAIGYFEDARGERYLMIQNQNREGGSFPNENTSATGVRVAFDFTGAPARFDRTRVEVFDHRTGQVAPVMLGGNGDARELRVRLEAGDIVFFKYATDRPFATQR
ncbi:MAG: hypothetical protein ACI9U2_003912 [Bradymonadia bacterium]|jgi:hypothetical protein